MKNIIIYTHMPKFSFENGGTIVQYFLANVLEEYGQNVRIYPSSGKKQKIPSSQNFIIMNFL